MKIDRCPLTPEEKHSMIAREAYYRYERRGGSGGDSALDWQEAESEIDYQINAFCRSRTRMLDFSVAKKIAREAAPVETLRRISQKALQFWEHFPAAVDKAGYGTRRQLVATGEGLSRRTGELWARGNELARAWSRKSTQLFDHASKKFKKLTNRQHR